MQKKILIFVMLIIMAYQAWGQKKLVKGPLNPSFIKYLKSHSSGVKPKFGQGYKLDYIPAPLNLFTGNKTKNSSSKLKSAQVISLPQTYDLRTLGYVTSIKDQGTGAAGGNCWAFATMGSIESNWLDMGYGTYDLSEENMVCCNGYYWGFGEGGNEFLALAYLSRFQGPVLNSEDPYNTSGNHTCVTGLSPVAYVPEARIAFSNIFLTKQIIMDYGGVYTPMCWDDASFRSSDNTYYYNGDEDPNHAIVLVGWDDTKPTAGGTGAWICKNSWGTSWGENGYFYISYNDTKVLSSVVYYPYRWNKWNVNNLYMYDELGTVATFGYNNPTAYALVKFTTSGTQYIKKIGTFVTATGSLIDIDIYASKNGDTLKNLLASVTNQLCRSAGFYTFDIPVQISGDFYVKVKYFCPGINYPIPIEVEVDNYAYPVIEPSGKEWVSEDGNVWQALGSDIPNWEADVSVRAYAVDSLGPKANFSMNKWEVCAGSSLTFTNQSIGTISSYSWNFGQDASPSTTTGSGPYTVTYASAAQTGLRQAKLIVLGPAGHDTIIKEFRVVNGGINVTLVSSLSDVKITDTTQLIALCDASSFSWTSTASLDVDTGKIINFHSGVAGTYRFTVTATQGTCTGATSLELQILQPPVNDDMCNAIQLSLGQNGPFTNVNATVQHNEPHPTDTCCTCPMTWCDEGGLQNSVWFKFTGPSNGDVSIDTKGFDDQIAVYNSNSCDSIEFSDLIAANDDYHNEAADDYAAALVMFSVVPGKTYWVQIDGSAGGDTCSNFYIYLYDGPLRIQANNINIGNEFKIIPNPNNGIFNIEYSSGSIENIIIQVYDFTGRLINDKMVRKNSDDINIPMNLSRQPEGFYLIRMVGEEGVKTGKVTIRNE